jgi:hypothetical protein
MSTELIKVVTPQTVVAPRGARWAAAAVVWITRVLFAHPSKLES